MPKKFTGENSKAVAVRARKAEAKHQERERKEAEKADAYWADDDKHVQRKLQRKNEAEQKRQSELEKRLANRKAYEEELGKIASSSCIVKQPNKITRAQIASQIELEEHRKSAIQNDTLNDSKLLVESEITENINQLFLNEDSARGIDEALQLFGNTPSAEDRHPEKRVRSAYLAFEEKRMTQLKIERPTFRLSQLKQLIKKEWQKSPENPINQKFM